MRLSTRKAIDLPASELREAFTTFRPALAGQAGRISAAVALALAATVLHLAKPWPITWVVDYVTAPVTGAAAPSADAGAAGAAAVGAAAPGPADLGPILLYALVALAIPVLLGFATERLELVVARISRTATVRIRTGVFEHIQRLEMTEHQRHYSGDLLVRLTGDVNMIRDLLFPAWLNLFQRGCLLVGASLVFVLVEWRLFLIAFAPLPLLWLSVDRGSAAVRDAVRKQRRKEGRIAATAAESFRNAGLIKAFAAEEQVAEGFRSNANRAEKATMAAARETARMASLSEILTGIGVAGVLVVGAMQVRAGLITPGQLVLAISYTRLMYKPVRKMTGEGARISKATACAMRVVELYRQPVEDPGKGRPDVDLDGPIDLYGVSHVYPDGRRSLDSLTARIPAGTLVAVTGENGTGKSTLLSLLLRLHRPTEGEIRVGGVPIDELSLTHYRSRIAYVPQELALFGGTIRENIAFGRPGATDDEILAAADLALLTPVLDRLPDGLDTVLDEDGSSLSGGQARRLMLARAAVRDASVVLLDEPLTGLDPDARMLVARAIRNIAAERTTLVVHHGDVGELGPDHQLDLTVRPQPSPSVAVELAGVGR